MSTLSTTIEKTTMNKSNLQLPAHPGEVLREWMRGNDKTIAETAAQLGASTSQLNRVLAGKVRLSATLAVRLENIGWSTAEVWSRMQAAWEVAEARRAEDAA